MKRLVPAFAAVVLLLLAAPAYAGDFSVGLGAGFGDNDVGPGVISGKYWDEWYEVGAELFYDNDKGDAIDQLALSWFIYRYNLYVEENNTPWLGVGFGKTFEANSYQDSFGFVSAMGWEGRDWGMEFKYGYFDPSLYSFVVYYGF